MVFWCRWAWLILLILFSFTAFYSSGIDTGVSHDKLKYLSITWSMMQSGHYLIPMMNGIPYTDKPPLFFWLIASAWHLLGINLFSVQFMIGCLLISWGLMTRAIYATLFPNDRQGKDLIPYLLIGSYAIWRDIWFLRVDLLLLTGILLCCLGIFKILAMHPRIKCAYSYIVLGTCIGLFAKGPIVYVFTLLPFMTSALFAKEYRAVFLKIIAAILLGTLIFLITWVIPVIINTSHVFAQQILYQQIAHRVSYSDKSYFIYLYLYIPTLFIPWVVNLIFFRKLSDTFKQISQYRPFMLSIFITSVMIFSCFGQKSLWYVLPLLPFGLIFLTRFFIEYKDQRRVICLNRFILSIIFASFGSLSIGLLFSPKVQGLVFKNFGGYFALSPWVMMSLAALSFMTVGYLIFSKRNLIGLVSAASVMLFLIYGLSNLYFFPFERAFTQINIVSAVLHETERNHAGIILYQSEYPGSFNYTAHLEEPILSVSTIGALKQWLEKHPHGVVIYNQKVCPEFEGMKEIAAYHEKAGSVAYLLCKKN